MQILLLGCSWSVPNYFGEPGDPAETHTEFLLKSLGHSVHNCGLNGGSNLQALNRARQYVQGNLIHHPAHIEQAIHWENPGDIDLVIWFHTEPGRDIDIISTEGKSIARQLNELCSIIYKQYAEFFNTLNAQVAVIGGCADVHPILYDYITPDFCLPSWQQKLLGASTMGFDLASGTTPTEEDIELIDNALKVIDLMKKSLYFPDNGHPGAAAHKELVELLAEKFKFIPR